MSSTTRPKGDTFKNRASATIQNGIKPPRRIEIIEGDLIYLYCTDHEDYGRPAAVQLALLRRVFRDSAWFARAQKTMKKHKRDALCLPADREVLSVLLFWTHHNQIPTISDLGEYTDALPHLDAREDHQFLIVRAWRFAAKVELPALQNALMHALFVTFDNSREGMRMSPENMQICLLVSSQGSMMRCALVHCMLWSDRLNDTMQVGSWSFRRNLRWEQKVDLTVVPGVERDLKDAEKVFERVHKITGARRARPRAGEFYVPEAAQGRSRLS